MKLLFTALFLGIAALELFMAGGWYERGDALEMWAGLARAVFITGAVCFFRFVPPPPAADCDDGNPCTKEDETP